MAERDSELLLGDPMKYLYWSHVKMMRECPQRYLWTKGHPNHDLGAGWGKPKPLPPEEKRSSEHHLLMGRVLSFVVERVYEDQLWREPSTLIQKAEEIAYQSYLEMEKECYLIWDYMTRDESIEICISGARNFIRIMKENRLLGPWSKAELKMTPSVDDQVNICGIADLVYKDNEGRVHIFDGKNAMTPNKYEDPDQLRWYALAYALEYGEQPHRIGFFYFRYPSDNPPTGYEPDEWTGIIEVSLTREQIKGLLQEASDIRNQVVEGVFEPRPKAKHCGMCPYEGVCEPRQEQRKANAAKRKKRTSKVEKAIAKDGGFTFGSL